MGIISFVSSINSYVVLFFIAFVFFLLIGFYIFLKDSKNKQNILFFVWDISFSIGCLGYMLMFWTPVESDVYFFANIAAIGYCTIWPIAINFLILFLKEKLNKLWMSVICVLYSIGVFYVYAALSGLSASAGYERTVYGWVDKPNNTILYPIYLVYVAVCVALVIYLLIKIKIVFNNSENYNKKKQASIMLNSAIPSIILGIFFNIIAPSNKLNLPSIGFIFSGIWILSVAYSIAKYKMFIWKTYIAPHVVDHLGEIIVVVDEGLHINYVNDIFYEKLEKEICDPTLLKLSDFVPDIDAIISHNEFSNNKIKEKEIDLISYGTDRNKIKTKVTGLPLVVDKYTKIVIFTFSDITYRIDKLMKNQDILLEILAYVAESKSIDFEKHIERMSEISVYIAEMYEKKFPNSNELIDLKYIKRAASLHDIGKFTISDSILNKNGKLSDIEFALVKEHTKKGFDIISTMEGVSNTIAASVAKNHHEKWDGTGYPYGLTKKDIPLIARIVSIADVVDALLTKRTYKEAMSIDYVEKYLEDEKGKSFDPDIIDLLLENNKYNYYKIIEIYNSL